MTYGSHKVDVGRTVPETTFAVMISEPDADGQCSPDGDAAAPAWSAEQQAERLAPVSMNWGANGKPTTLELRRVLGGRQGLGDERAEAHLAAPHGVRVRLVENRVGESDGRHIEIEWFAGHVGMDGVLIQGDPQTERYTLTAYGPEIRLAAKVVCGQWFADDTVDDMEIARVGSAAARATIRMRRHVLATHVPAVFNAGGRPNCSPTDWKLSDDVDGESPTRGARVFESPGRKVRFFGDEPNVEAVHWTAYHAVRSIVEWVDNYDVISPGATDWGAIAEVLGNDPLGEVDVEGLPLTRALGAVLNPLGYGYCLEPWSSEPWKHLLIVYSLKNPACRLAPRLAAFGCSIGSDEGGLGEVHRLHFIRDSHNVRNDVRVLGDYQQVQVELEFNSDKATRDLWPYWDTFAQSLANYATDGKVSLEDLPADKRRLLNARHNPTGKDFARYTHVWRSFCWNEDGAASQFAYRQGTPVIPNPAARWGLGVDWRCARRARPVGETFTYDSDARSHTIPARVWLIADGHDDVKVEVPARIWNDRAGFTITQAFFTLGRLQEVRPWRPFAEVVFPEEFDKNLAKDLANAGYLTLLHNTLQDTGRKIRLVLAGSIDDDLCVEGRAPRRTASSWPLAAVKVVRAPGRFRKRIAIAGLSGHADLADDTSAARAYAERIREASEDRLGHGSLMLRHLARTYHPGIAVPRTHGRVVDLRVDGGGGSACPVARAVRFRFDAGTTELLLDSPLLKVTR